jgi:iron-sulfur cluster assembly protein
MIDLTEKAASELAAMLQRKCAPAGSGLRLGISRGGCAGMQYIMAVQPPEPGDLTVEAHGVLLHVAADSVGILRGCQIDYSDTLADAGFKISNPNAARSCGCGTSFETREPDPEASFSTASDGNSSCAEGN